MVAPQAMRTVWLALLCLIGLATTVIVKIVISSDGPAKTAPTTNAGVLPPAALTDAVALSSENLMAGSKVQSSPSNKTDKLEVSKEAAPDVKPVEPIAIGLSTAQPKQLSKTAGRIVTRHWHAPADEPSAAAQPTPKGKLSKRAQPAEAFIATRIEIPIGER